MKKKTIAKPLMAVGVVVMAMGLAIFEFPDQYSGASSWTVMGLIVAAVGVIMSFVGYMIAGRAREEESEKQVQTMIANRESARQETMARLAAKNNAMSKRIHLLRAVDKFAQEGDVAGQIDSLEQYVALELNDTARLRELADLYRETGDIDNAASCYKKAIKFKPRDPEAYFSIVDMYSAAGEKVKARYFAAEMLDNVPESEPKYAQMKEKYELLRDEGTAVIKTKEEERAEALELGFLVE